MQYFTQIPEGQAIIHNKGIYKQVPLYERGGRAYAKQGTGFVRLNQGGSTSQPNTRWSEVDAGDASCTEEKGGVWVQIPHAGAAE